MDLAKEWTCSEEYQNLDSNKVTIYAVIKSHQYVTLYQNGLFEKFRMVGTRTK